MSEWKMETYRPLYATELSYVYLKEDEQFIAARVPFQVARQILRDHNAVPKVREALNDCIEALDGAINIPDPSDEDRECFRRVSQKAKAVLAETEAD